MEIQLTRGYKTVIDDEDWDLVKGYRWVALVCSKGVKVPKVYAISYWYEDGVKRHLAMHRLMLGLTDPRVFVDHIDGDGLNNRRSNIRTCTHSENMRNSKCRAHSGTQVRNVSFEGGRYRARVNVDGKRHGKSFKTMEAAVEWVTSLRKTLHGEFFFEGSK